MIRILYIQKANLLIYSCFVCIVDNKVGLLTFFVFYLYQGFILVRMVFKNCQNPGRFIDRYRGDMSVNWLLFVHVSRSWLLDRNKTYNRMFQKMLCRKGIPNKCQTYVAPGQIKRIIRRARRLTKEILNPNPILMYNGEG